MKSPNKTNDLLFNIAEVMNQFRKLYQLHGIEITGITVNTTCPFCNRNRFSIRLKNFSGKCNVCGKKLSDYREFEKYYLIYFEQKERREVKRNSTFRRMMEKPEDIIY